MRRSRRGGSNLDRPTKQLSLTFFFKETPQSAEDNGYIRPVFFPGRTRGGQAMVRDSVTNLVVRLQECGFDPRRIGDDAWEARCPAHRSSDYALSITRGELGHVTLECRGTQKCQEIRIIRALGFTTEHVYEETPEWLINRLKHAPIQPASFGERSRACAPRRGLGHFGRRSARVWIADFGLPIESRGGLGHFGGRSARGLPAAGGYRQTRG